jgi:hypothetical protein
MRNNLKGNTSQTGTPTPTSPIPVNVVSGDNEVVLCGKNLLNPNDCYLFNSHKYIGTPSYASVGKIVVEPNTTYSLINDKTLDIPDFNIWEYDINNSNKTVATKTNTTSGDFRLLTFTTKNTTKYISFYEGGYAAYNSVNEMVDTIKLMLVKGNSIPTSLSEYELYQADTYNIDLPSGMELCKIGNYQDYFYKDSGKWYLHKEIGKVVLNGSENITAYDATSLTGSYQATFDILTKPTNTEKIILSDNFLGSLLNDRSIKTNIIYTFTDGKLRIANNITTSMNDFKTWLSNNNTTVYYVLSTPTSTEITDTTLINQLEELYIAKSKENQTNISQINNDLPFIISASALKKG